MRVADAVEAGEHVLDVDGGVVRDVLLVERTVRRDQVDHQHQVGRLLAHRDAEALHLLRQSRDRDRDAVLHQHLGLVDVGAGLEHRPGSTTSRRRSIATPYRSCRRRR